MRNQGQQDKDFYLIAKRIKNEQKHQSSELQVQLQERYRKQSEQALKMINAYRKVENVKSNTSNKIVIGDKSKQSLASTNQQPKSSYANKIKQTLRQLNANKARQLQKMSQRNTQVNNSRNINSLKVSNQMGVKAKSEGEKKLMMKSAQKLWSLVGSVIKRKMRESLRLVIECSQGKLQKDYLMARKYRVFRLFSLWREEINVMKVQNQKRRKQLEQKQIQGTQMAKEFYIFKTEKKVIKSWSKITKNQKKKRKYEEEIRKIELEKHIETNKGETKTLNQKSQSEQGLPPQSQNVLPPQSQNGQLQNKLRGFLDGLKEKIENKEQKPNLKQKQEQRRLHSISEQKQQSQRASGVFSQHVQIQHQQSNNYNQLNQHSQHQHQHQHQQTQENIQHPSQSQPIKPLSNEQLQKRRQQIYQRSKNRKQALQKLKREKEMSKQKEEEERRELQRKMDQQQKQVKELKYKQFQQKKKQQKQWELKQTQLNNKANQHNILRILKHYGFAPWKTLKALNIYKAQRVKQVLQKVMIRHAGRELIDNLQQHLEQVLSKMYSKMDSIYSRNLKRKCMKGYKLQLSQCLQQKANMQAFHQVHTQKIYLSQWRQVIDLLRLENMEEQRPLIRKANDYYRVLLMMKSIRMLRVNAVESKKEKNITEQKLKIKSKIKNIISEKIDINYDDFL